MTEPTTSDAFEALVATRGGHLLVVLDDRLRIVRAGSDAAELADRPLDALSGMSLIAAFGSAALDAMAREAVGTRVAVSGEADLGALGMRQFAVDAVPVRGGGVVLSMHDVTRLRHMERVRRDFVANVSHELRTPLTSVKLLAETLGAGAVDDQPTVRDFANRIEREADHLSRLVDQLLDLSIIESGAMQLALEAVDPDAALDECAQRIGPVAARRGVEVVVTGARERGTERAIADRARLGQALLNLADNAVKYSRPGGQVRLGWEPRGAYVRFTVSDDGIGIASAHQARIFERFYKADRARARGEHDDTASGAGLGLAIVRHIAEAHRGAVGVSSTPGAGSTFWLEVPEAAVGDAAETEESG